MERQKKQREETLTQVLRYVTMDTSTTAVQSYLCLMRCLFFRRATDKARSILKESSESLNQATSTIPPQLLGERAPGGREEEESMDTSSATTAASVSIQN